MVEGFERKFGAYYSAENPHLDTSISKAKNNQYILDHISNHYIFEEQVHMSFNILRKYEHLIRSNVVEVDMKNDWLYKPEYCSFDAYGTTDFWYLIMFVNNITKPAQFIMSKVKLVTEDFITEAFKSIISQEKNMRNSYTEPKMIYKHTLKSLNEPSTQVIPTEFDETLGNLISFSNYEEKTDILDLKNYYNENDVLVNGILKTSFRKGDSKNKIRPIYKNYVFNANYDQLDYYGDYNYYPGGLVDTYGATNDNTIIIEKEGLFKVNKTGMYYIKGLSSGTLEVYINGKNLLYNDSSDILSSSYVKNVLEEYSLNSDFKRRNLDFWEIGQCAGMSKNSIRDLSTPVKDEDILVYDDYLNKTVLMANCTNKDYLYGYNYRELDKRNLICAMEVPMNKIKFDHTTGIILVIDYRVIGKHPNDAVLARYNKFIAVLEFTYKDGTTFKIIKETSDYKEIPEIKTYDEKMKYYKKPINEVFVFSSERFNDDVESFKISLHMGEFSGISRNVNERIPKLQYAISAFNLLCPNMNEQMIGIHLDKDIWYEWLSIVTKNYYDPDFINMEYSYETTEDFREIPQTCFYYNFSVREKSPKNITINNLPYYKKALKWKNFNANAEKKLDQYVYSHNYVNTYTYSIPLMFELSIFDITNGKNELYKQLLVENISQTHTEFYKKFDLPHDNGERYKFLYRIPHLLHYDSDYKGSDKYFLIENAYCEGEYADTKEEILFNKDWYKIGNDYTGNISITAVNDNRIKMYIVTNAVFDEYNEVYRNRIKLFENSNMKSNATGNQSITINKFDISHNIHHLTDKSNCIIDFVFEVIPENDTEILDYEIKCRFNSNNSLGYVKIDDFFKNLSTTSNSELNSKNINNPGYFYDVPLSLPLNYNNIGILKDDTSYKEYSIYPYSFSYNSLFKMINNSFDDTVLTNYTDKSVFEDLDDEINRIKDTLNNFDITEEDRNKFLNSLCRSRYDKNCIKISEIVEKINKRYESFNDDDNWIYSITFNRVENKYVNLDESKPYVRMKGIFGVYLNYKGKSDNYLIVWNFFNNSKYIESGLYKCSGKIDHNSFYTANFSNLNKRLKLISTDEGNVKLNSKESNEVNTMWFEGIKSSDTDESTEIVQGKKLMNYYREDMTHNNFKESLVLLKAIPELTSDNYMERNFKYTKNFIIIKYKDFIIFRMDNDRYPFLTYHDLELPLKGGTIGNLGFGVEGFNYSVKLWK